MVRERKSEALVQKGEKEITGFFKTTNGTTATVKSVATTAYGGVSGVACGGGGGASWGGDNLIYGGTTGSITVNPNTIWSNCTISIGNSTCVTITTPNGVYEEMSKPITYLNSLLLRVIDVSDNDIENRLVLEKKLFDKGQNGNFDQGKILLKQAKGINDALDYYNTQAKAEVSLDDLSISVKWVESWPIKTKD